MSTDYRPSLAEITARTFRELRDDSRKLAKSVPRAGRMLLVNAAFLNAAPYGVPTAAYMISKKDGTGTSSPEEIFGLAGAILVGAGGLVLQMLAYRQAAEDGHPEYWLIPVATNAVSAAYEKVRGVRNRLIDEFTQGDEKCRL
ncbi:MAG: hypothetical protein HY518_01860 [Candidatus Aenigmarchaeota archaeon]|nr:hypothetical protein [Candidatus Aenigmarchaeota archaeon]